MQCCLKVLVVRKCQLGLAGVLHIIEALSKNSCLEELNLAGNSVPNELSALSVKGCSQMQEQKLDIVKVDDNQEVLCSLTAKTTETLTAISLKLLIVKIFQLE